MTRGSVLSETTSKVMLLALSTSEIAVLRVALLQLIDQKEGMDGATNQLRSLLGKLPPVASGPPGDSNRAPF